MRTSTWVPGIVAVGCLACGVPTGRILVVNGEDVQVFQFTDEASAKSAAGLVSSDGTAVGTVMVTWIAPPHFHLKGRLIALYVGSGLPVIAALQAVMGPQFAG